MGGSNPTLTCLTPPQVNILPSCACALLPLLQWQEKARHRVASVELSVNVSGPAYPPCNPQPLARLPYRPTDRLQHTMPAHLRASMTVITTQSVCVNNLSLEERDVLDGIRATHEAHKPANTIKAYSRPQAEWHEWCLARAEKNGGKPLEEYPVQERSVEETRRYVFTHASI